VDHSSNPNRQVASAAGIVMLAFILSQFAGLIRRMLVARVFGTSIELDAFIASNRVSETIFTLIAGGALGSAFIPIFTELITKGEKEKAWNLASAILNLVFISLCGMAVIAFIFAPQIVRYLLASGFSDDPQLIHLTVNLLRIQLVSSILFGLSGLVMGILNSNQVFLVPALTPAMYQLGLIFGVLILSPHIGIYGLAWGVVLGALLHLTMQLPTLLKQKGSYTLDLGIGNPAVWDVIRLMIPRFFGVAVVQLNFWVNTALASQMSAGSLVGVDYGFSLMLMAQIIIAQSVATAMMPTLASLFALGKLEEVRNTLSAALRGVLFLAVPASIGLILLRQPVIQLLYQRGDFNNQSTELVSWALLWYATGLVGHSLLEILARAFYALHDTKTPVLVGASAMGLNIVLSLFFSSFFLRVGWMPLGGLALANSLATALESIVLLILIRNRLHGIHGRSLFIGLGQFLVATFFMGLALVSWLNWFSTVSTWMVVLGGVTIGGFVYGLSTWFMRIPEIQLVLGILKKKSIR
jgi:putative peptidoglycan lipid II flippase